MISCCINIKANQSKSFKQRCCRKHNQENDQGFPFDFLPESISNQPPYTEIRNTNEQEIADKDIRKFSSKQKTEYFPKIKSPISKSGVTKLRHFPIFSLSKTYTIISTYRIAPKYQRCPFSGDSLKTINFRKFSIVNVSAKKLMFRLNTA